MSDKIRTDVFISSTSIDLPEYREVVKNTLLGLGLFPLGMETWPRTGENPVDKCRKMVFDSHIYIGIFAHRYGWQPKQGGKSITELEYDWAGEKGILRLCYVVQDDYEWDESLKEKDKQKELDVFKQRIRTDEVGFFTTPDNLAKQIAIDLSKYFENIPDLDDYYIWLHQLSKKSNLLMALSHNEVYQKRSITIDEVYTPLHVEGGSGAMEIANRHKRLVLLGDPGGGKTVFMNYLAMCITGSLINTGENWQEQLKRDGWEHGKLLPIPIVLRDFAAGLTDNTFKAVTDHLHRLCVDKAFEPAIMDGMKQYLKSGQALVLFDGLDEVPNDKRGIVRDALHDFMERYPYNRYIVTCRILSYANRDWQLREMDATETFAQLNKEQIAHFVKSWYTIRANSTVITQDEAHKRIKELTERLTDEDLQEMATNPMLLTVMTFVHNSTGTLPKEKARLYDQCVDWLMYRWKQEEFNALFKEMNLRGEKDLYKILWEIAYDAHSKQADKKGAADISEEQIIKIVKKYVNNDLGLAQKFCNYVEERAGLLLGRGIQNDWRVFTFPHRTFQEFLAGRYLLIDNFEELAPEIAKLGVNWREVMLLACGYLVYEQGNDNSVLRAIREILYIEPKTVDDWWGIWLASEMLLIIGIDRAKETKLWERIGELIQRRFVEFMQNEQLNVKQRAKIGQLLNPIGDPRPGVGTVMVNWFTLPDVVWCHIPAGEFIMGGGNETHTLHLDDFYMSRYLVTYTQYQAFETAPDFSDEAWWKGFPEDEKCVRYDQYFQYANHPRETVTWYGALAFCRWLTHHINDKGVPMQVWDVQAKKYSEMPYPKMTITLPSEAEYEKMARGTDGRIYPYGNDYDPNKGNTDNTGIGMTTAVGLFPDGGSPYGVLDASGNVWTWTYSLDKKYKYNSEDGREDENGTGVRIMRGGSWNDYSDFARASCRVRNSPPFKNNFIGFFVVCRPY